MGRVVDDALDSGDSTLGADLATLLGDGRLTASSLPLLGMGRDIPDGVLHIDERGRLEVDWTIETSIDYFHGVRETMRAIAAQLGGTFVDNPLWWAKRVITVHPIGGASMGRSPSDGLCDAYGEVFGHPGLYVMDGALLPGAGRPQPVADDRSGGRPGLHAPARDLAVGLGPRAGGGDRRGPWRRRRGTGRHGIRAGGAGRRRPRGERPAVHREDEGLRGPARRRPAHRVRPRQGAAATG